MEKNKIKIIGLDTSTREISAEKRLLILSSDVLAGGKRHLDLFADFKSTKIPITHDIPGLINDIKQHLEKGLSISVLASGDPLLFGIGNRLIKKFGIDSVEIHPGISAVQTALSRLGLKTDNTLVINRHASQKESLEKICYHDLSVILTSEKHTPADVISELTARYPWSSEWRGHICECIGMGRENIRSGNLNELANVTLFNAPNLLVLENPNPVNPSQVSSSFGRQDNEFEHDANMITHPEVRAVTLSKLMLKNSEVMWDIGAGSGSVGIEAALLDPLLNVYCIEKNEERAARIIKNKKKYKTANLTPVHGNATEICPSLPMPDRIFIGGGGKDLEEILAFCYQALKKNGIIVVNTVTLEAFETVRDFCIAGDMDYEIVEIQVLRQYSLSGYHMLKPDNPVKIISVKR